MQMAALAYFRQCGGRPAAGMLQLEDMPGRDWSHNADRPRRPSPPPGSQRSPLALEDRPRSDADQYRRPDESTQGHSESEAIRDDRSHGGSAAQGHGCSETTLELPRPRKKRSPLDADTSVDDLLATLAKAKAAKKHRAAKAGDDDDSDDGGNDKSGGTDPSDDQTSAVAIKKKPSVASKAAPLVKGAASSKPAPGGATSLAAIKKSLGYVKGGPPEGVATPDLTVDGALTYNGCRIYIKPAAKTMRVVPFSLRYDRKFVWPSKKDGKTRRLCGNLL